MTDTPKNQIRASGWLEISECCGYEGRREQTGLGSFQRPPLQQSLWAKGYVLGSWVPRPAGFIFSQRRTFWPHTRPFPGLSNLKSFEVGLIIHPFYRQGN